MNARSTPTGSRRSSSPTTMPASRSRPRAPGRRGAPLRDAIAAAGSHGCSEPAVDPDRSVPHLGESPPLQGRLIVIFALVAAPRQLDLCVRRLLVGDAAQD